MRLTTLAMSVLMIPAVSLGVGVYVVGATPQMLSEAKKAGMPAKNCQYCHTEADAEEGHLQAGEP